MKYINFRKNSYHTKNDNLKKFLHNNKLLIFLSIILLAGIFLGAVLIKLADKNILKLINILFLSDFKESLSKNLLDTFISSISSTFIFILISFFMGLSIWGFILAPIIPFIRGICIGLSECYFYSVYGIKGICFYTLVFLPGIFISSIAILLMTRESIKISNSFSSIIFCKNKLDNIYKSTQLYLLRSGCISIIVIISSATDLISTLLFSKFFSF